MAPSPPLTLLVHRPGRMVAIVAAAALVVGGALVIVLQLGVGTASGWWTLAAVVPMMIGLAATMRTGTSRCEVSWDERGLTVRSVDASHVLGRRREAEYRWRDVVGAARSGTQGDRLRVECTTAPRVLIFSGSSRALDTLHTALAQARAADSKSG